jgi:hypothetical protein
MMRANHDGSEAEWIKVGDRVLRKNDARSGGPPGVVWVVDHLFVSLHDGHLRARLRTDAPPGRWKKRYVRVKNLLPVKT